MEVIEPKRENRLPHYRLQLVEHTATGQAPGLRDLDNVYPFTTVADIKRQIWIAHDGDPQWSPNRQWVAYETDDGLYKPIDMSWSDQTSLNHGVPSPFVTPGTPDLRIVDSEGNRKAIYPVLNEGLLFESLFSEPKPLHVWTVESLVKAIGTKLEEKGVLAGYIQLYFPRIQTKERALVGGDESYPAAREYMRLRLERLAAIDNTLQLPATQEAEGFKLRQLRRWLATIDAPADVKSLDIMFYEFKTSAKLPFLRYFPAGSRSEPLLKLAAGPAGFPLISDSDMLESFMEEEPSRDLGAVLIAKIPFRSLAGEVRATRNVALVITWLEDGSATAILEAPRRDMLLERSTFEDALTLLRDALHSVGYNRPKIHLSELSATYRIEIQGPRLTQGSLQARIPFFSPFLEESLYQEKSNTKLSLKWKAVDNYEQEGSVYSYLTAQVLGGDFSGDTKDVIQGLIQGVVSEFGRSEEEAKRLFDDWFRRRTEVVPTGTDAVIAHNTGVDIEITLSHPVYFVSLVGIDSERSFKRIISILTAFFHYQVEVPAEPTPEPPQAPRVNAVQNTKVAAEAQAERAKWMDLLNDEEEEEEEAEQDAAAPQEGPRPTAAPQNAKIAKLEPLKEWYKAQLDRYDEKLFGYSQTDKSVTVYSRTCQASSARQPNILVAEQVDALMREYGDAVEWVFLPPPDNIILDVGLLSNKELIDEMVKRGFKDVADEKGKPLKKKAELKQIFEDALCAENSVQGQFCRILRKRSPDEAPAKPYWFIARAGSNPEKPYYFICPHYWCVRDGKPLIPSEFEGTQTRSGLKKDANSCPFCGGIIIEDPKQPKMGQTVLKRKGKPGKGEIHDIAGYMDNIHPSKFALPCCFTRPTVTQIKPAEGTEMLPKDTRRGAAPEPQLKQQADQEDGEEVEHDELEDAELTKIFRTIRTQYVLGYEKRQLESGRIGLCPLALDAFLGQNGAESVKKKVGVAQHLNPKSTHHFFRFGLGQRGSPPGLSFLELLGYYLGNLQRAGRPPLKGAKLETPTILTPAGALKTIFPDDTPKDHAFIINLRRAFERANYGNLVHEFAGSSNTLTDGQIQKFAQDQGFNLTANPHMRPHVVRLANAWNNFKTFIEDVSAPKNMKHFENLFATPGVIFPEGLLLVILEGRSNSETGEVSVSIRCPNYGISQHSQLYKPPVAFVWNDVALGSYEPLIYVEATGKEDKKKKPVFLTLATIHSQTAKFREINPTIQTAMKDFITQYLDTKEGCGRYSSPSHPWMPNEATPLVPRLNLLLAIKTITPAAILRDRSNRLVGINYNFGDQQLFVPVIDDGSLGIAVPSVYDTESIPYPSLDTLLNAYGNKEGLGRLQALKVSEIIIDAKEQKFTAVRLACGALVPFNAFPITQVSTHPQFTELIKKGASTIQTTPWNEDARFLRIEQLSKETLDIVPEAVVDEAYQYLRLSFSEWLKTRQGTGVLKQLKALRKSGLPLYELRRRGDILLEPLITNWIDASDHQTIIQSLPMLRKNCLVQKDKETCESNPICSWIGDECKIHAGTSEKIPNVVVYFTHKLVDEILRFPVKAKELMSGQVSHIHPPLGLVRTEEELLTSKTKITNLIDELDLDYVPEDDYSAGLSYPENAHNDTLGRQTRPEFIDIPIDWKQAGLYRMPYDPSIESRLITSIQIWTGEKLPAITKKIAEVRKKQGAVPKQLNWSDTDWWCFGKAYGRNLFITQYNSESGLVRITKFLNTGSTKYGFILIIEQPEILLASKNPILAADLPKVFSTFLDSGFSYNWASLKEPPVA